MERGGGGIYPSFLFCRPLPLDIHRQKVYSNGNQKSKRGREEYAAFSFLEKGAPKGCCERPKEIPAEDHL